MNTTNAKKTATEELSIIPTLTLNPVSWFRWWLTPRSLDRDTAFRERVLRHTILVFMLFLVGISPLAAVSGSSSDEVRRQLVSIAFALVILTLAAGILHIGARAFTAWMILGLLMSGSISTILDQNYWTTLSAVYIFLIVAYGQLVLRNHQLWLSRLVAFSLAILPFFTGNIGEIDLTHGLYGLRELRPDFTAIVVAVGVVSLIAMLRGLVLEYESSLREIRNFARTLETRVQERTRDIEAAAAVSAKVTSATDQDQLLQEIVDLTVNAFSLSQVKVYLFDDARRDLTNVGNQSRIDGKPSNYPSLAIDSQNVVAVCARQLEPIVVSNDDHSQLVIPIVINKRLIGVFELQSVEPDHFTDEAVRALTSIAEHVGIGVQGARLYKRQDQLIDELRRADQVKSQFLASMSHELRTPLNAILNFARFNVMGVYGELTDRQHDSMDKIIGSAEHLLDLINDVLDVAKIESNMLQLFIEKDVDLLAELAAIVSSAESLLSSKSARVQLNQDVDHNLPTIVADRRRIRQVILNLVSNACKFTESGSVTISAKHRQDKVHIAVLDTGPGIPEDQIEIIFEPFQQSETGIKHSGGTGLGLAIAKRLVEAHEGRIWVDTEVGEGSAFHVELPVNSPGLLAQIRDEQMQVQAD